MHRSSAAPDWLPRLLLAASACAYAAAVVAASLDPDARNWGIHLAGFLPVAARSLVLALIVGGAAAIAAAAVRRPDEAARKSARPRSGSHEQPKRRAKSAEAVPPRGTWVLVLPVYGLLLYALRARTHFLGDGIVWLNALRGGIDQPFNEPLAAFAWKGFASATRAIGFPPDEATYAWLPALCGVAAAALGWGIVREGIPDRRARWIAWALFLTVGTAQIYFGYIESYPVASLGILLFLWLALRHVRGAGPPWLLGVALAAAIACHMVALFLLPAYLVTVLRRRGSRPGRIALALLPLVLAPALLLALGTGPGNWVGPFRTAARASPFGGGAALYARPYPLLSVNHAIDVANAIALALPVPALLLLAWVASRNGRIRPKSPAAQVVGVAALTGFALAAGLSLPVAPAQDWDLSAVLLLPAAVAGILTMRSLGAARAPHMGAGLITLSVGSLLAFVLVNANEAAGIRRFRVLMGPGAEISSYGRGYGNSMLSEFYEDRGEPNAALAFAEKALSAEPTNARYWVRAGTILYNLGRHGEAIEKLEESVRRGITRPEAFYNLGLCYIKTGRPRDAARQFRAAVERAPARPDFRHNLGVALFESGETESARAVWAEVLRRWPDYTLTARSMERRFGKKPPQP